MGMFMMSACCDVSAPLGCEQVCAVPTALSGARQLLLIHRPTREPAILLHCWPPSQWAPRSARR